MNLLYCLGRAPLDKKIPNETLTKQSAEASGLRACRSDIDFSFTSESGVDGIGILTDSFFEPKIMENHKIHVSGASWGVWGRVWAPLGRLLASFKSHWAANWKAKISKNR